MPGASSMPSRRSVRLSGPQVIFQHLTLRIGAWRSRRPSGIHQVDVAVPGAVRDALDLASDPDRPAPGERPVQSALDLVVEVGDGQGVGVQVHQHFVESGRHGVNPTEGPGPLRRFPASATTGSVPRGPGGWHTVSDGESAG